MVIYTVYTALENRKIAFNGVCADYDIALFASVELPKVPNCAGTAEMLTKSTVPRWKPGHKLLKIEMLHHRSDFA
jgi:hypothetical protein